MQTQRYVAGDIEKDTNLSFLQRSPLVNHPLHQPTHTALVVRDFHTCIPAPREKENINNQQENNQQARRKTGHRIDNDMSALGES